MDGEHRIFDGQLGLVRGRSDGDGGGDRSLAEDARSDHLGLERYPLTELSVRECLALLPSVTDGHLAVTHRALPAVIPVRLFVVDDAIVVTSMLGDAVPLRARSVVALGAGTLGRGLPEEWTVEVCGFLAHWMRPDEDNPGREAFSVSTDYVRGWRST
jgi:hypothetical protein